MHLSIIIPAFNESQKIVKDLEAAASYLEERQGGEVLVIDDGSRDTTAAVAEAAIHRLRSRKVSVRVLGYPHNRGKGYAIRHGIRRAKGDYIAFVDAGLCVPLSFLSEGIQKIEEGFDFAIGSRRVSGAKIDRPNAFYRRLGSQLFGKMVRLGLGITLSDTQCGFKVYRGEVAKEIFSKVQTNGFMFDIEAILVAERFNYRGVEFPVEWTADFDSRYRPILGTLRNLSEIARIRFRHG